jgi:hypothetical protein
MGSGRTKPCLFACEDADGNPAGDYVVKLRGGIESAETGLFCELLAALLALHFNLAIPNPAIVQIDNRMADLVPDPAVAAILRKSSGLNFGSKLLTGIHTWPVDRHVPVVLHTVGAEIFAFDALIQNPDRKFSNPNLLADEDHLYPIDHECAFAFRYSISPEAEPWRLDGRESEYLREHVFFRQLKGKPIDLVQFEEKLGGLIPQVSNEMISQIPMEWQVGFEEKVRSHFSKINEHAQDFIDQVKARLA